MWILCAFLSAFFLGIYDACKKRALRNNAVLPVLCLNTLFCSLLFLPPVLLSAGGWIDSSSLFYTPVQGWNVQKFIILKSILVLSSWICGYYGLKHLPLTLVGPINATRPVMVLLGALILYGEHLNLWQWTGVLLAILSFFLLSKSGRKEGIDFRHNHWVVLVVAAAVLGAASGLFDKFLLASPEDGGVGLDRMVVQSYFCFYQFLLMAMLLMLERNTWRGKFHWHWSILCVSLFLAAADFVYFYALGLHGALVSIISLARRSSVIVSFLVGAFVFREKNLRSKTIDLLLVLLGMLFLYFGTIK